MEEQVAESVDESVEESTEEQVAESVDESVEESTEEQVAESVDESVEESTEEQVAESVDESVEESTEEQVVESVDESVESTEQVAESVDESVEEPTEEQVAESVWMNRLRSRPRSRWPSRWMNRLRSRPRSRWPSRWMNRLRSRLRNCWPNRWTKSITGSTEEQIVGIAEGRLEAEVDELIDDIEYGIDIDERRIHRDQWLVMVEPQVLMNSQKRVIFLISSPSFPGLAYASLKSRLRPVDISAARDGIVDVVGSDRAEVDLNHIYTAGAPETESFEAGIAPSEAMAFPGDLAAMDLRIGIVDSDGTSAIRPLLRPRSPPVPLPTRLICPISMARLSHRS